MNLGLADKVAIVTGGGSGVGGAISQRLAEEGAIPVILARRMPEAEVMARLTEAQPKTHVITLELADDARVTSAVTEIVERFDRIDGLVNNAGVNDSVGLDAGPAEFPRFAGA